MRQRVIGYHFAMTLLIFSGERPSRRPVLQRRADETPVAIVLPQIRVQGRRPRRIRVGFQEYFKVRQADLKMTRAPAIQYLPQGSGLRFAGRLLPHPNDTLREEIAAGKGLGVRVKLRRAGTSNRQSEEEREQANWRNGTLGRGRGSHRLGRVFFRCAP